VDEDRDLCEKWVKEGKLESELGLDTETIDSAIRSAPSFLLFDVDMKRGCLYASLCAFGRAGS